MFNLSSDRRFGRFFIAPALLEEIRAGCDVDMFHNMEVVQTMHDLLTDRIEYFAVHPDFEAIPQGTRVPLYEAVFTPSCAYPTWKKTPD